MSNIKYHTIDPMILQTLNLNQRRMNHILDILHGRTSNQKQQPVKIKNNKYAFQNSLRQNYKTLNSSPLPSIVKRNQTLSLQKSKPQKKYLTFDSAKNNNKPKNKSLNKSIAIQNSNVKNQEQIIEYNNKQFSRVNRKDRSQRKPTVNQQIIPVSYLNFSKVQTSPNQKIKSNPRNSLSAVRNKFSFNKADSLFSPSLRDLSPPEVNEKQAYLEDSLLPNSLVRERPIITTNFRQKTKQILSDYIGEYSLKKSKSMQVLNPKDIYRLQIQNIVAQLTSIQKMQQAQKRMKRIKRRFQNLKHFDQRYYSKLNQLDLINL